MKSHVPFVWLKKNSWAEQKQTLDSLEDFVLISRLKYELHIFSMIKGKL